MDNRSEPNRNLRRITGHLSALTTERQPAWTIVGVPAGYGSDSGRVPYGVIAARDAKESP
jgi:hypothetical protein